MSEEVFDVILQSTGHFHAGVFTYPQNCPPEEDFSLGHEFWVGSLPNGIRSDLVFDPCDSAGFNFRPARQYGMRYAFCRRVQPDQTTSICRQIRQFAEMIGESAPSYWVVYDLVRELPDNLLTLAHQGGKAYGENSIWCFAARHRSRMRSGRWITRSSIFYYNGKIDRKSVV